MGPQLAGLLLLKRIPSDVEPLVTGAKREARASSEKVKRSCGTVVERRVAVEQ